MKRLRLGPLGKAVEHKFILFFCLCASTLYKNALCDYYLFRFSKGSRLTQAKPQGETSIIKQTSVFHNVTRRFTQQGYCIFDSFDQIFVRPVQWYRGRQGNHEISTVKVCETQQVSSSSSVFSQVFSIRTDNKTVLIGLIKERK